MNNMSDAYNRIYSFHGRNEPKGSSSGDKKDMFVPFHSSRMEHHENDHNAKPQQSEQTAKNIQKEKNGEHTPRRNRRSEPKPLILKPPKIEAKQINVTNKDKEAKEVAAHSKGEKSQETSNNMKSKTKKLKAGDSFMLTPFSPMLKWSPSLPAKNNSAHTQFFLKNEDMLDAEEEKIDAYMKEFYKSVDESSFDKKLLEEFYFMLGEEMIPSEANRPSGEDIGENESFDLSVESSTAAGDQKSSHRINLNEANEALENDFLLMLEEDSEEDSVHVEESDKDTEMEDFNTVESSVSLADSTNSMNDQEYPLENKFLKMLAESSSVEDSLPIPHQDETFTVLSDLYSDKDESSQEPYDLPYESEHIHEYPEETSDQEDSVILDQDTSSKFTLEGTDLYKGEYSNLLEKAYSILEASPNEKGFQESFKEFVLPESSTIQEVFSKFLKDAHMSKSGEDTDEGSSEELNKVSSLLQGFSYLLASMEDDHINEESSSSHNHLMDQESEHHHETESFSDHNESVESLNDTYFGENYEQQHLSEDDSCWVQDENRSSLFEEEDSSSSPEESSCLQEIIEHETKQKENAEESCHHTPTRECLPKKQMPIVKLPVLIGKLDVDVDIFEAFPANVPIQNISSLDWYSQSLETHAALPSNVVFLKGTLVAVLDYVTNNKSDSIQSVKIQIPWKKNVTIDWIYPPDLPISNSKKEFTFKDESDTNVTSHYESSTTFSENIDSQLRTINVVWHNSMTHDEKSMLEVQGTATLKIDLLQEQYVDLGYK
jgi:hypothetical protein